MMQLGSIIMMLGVAIQVSAIKGHMAGVQFCVGRVSKSREPGPTFFFPTDAAPYSVTGVGNGEDVMI